MYLLRIETLYRRGGSEENKIPLCWWHVAQTVLFYPRVITENKLCDSWQQEKAFSLLDIAENKLKKASSSFSSDRPEKSNTFWTKTHQGERSMPFLSLSLSFSLPSGHSLLLLLMPFSVSVSNLASAREKKGKNKGATFHTGGINNGARATIECVAWRGYTIFEIT